MARPRTDDGQELNAEFAVVRDGRHPSLLMESAGGRSALRLLLGRLRALNAVLLSAEQLPDPVDLADVADVDELRLRIAHKSDDRQRIQLRLAVPGYGPEDIDQLAEDLANPVAPATGSVSYTSDDLLADVRQLKQHRTPAGRVSLHKPLALLWMIDHVAAGGTRLVAWPEFRREVGAFLAEFAPAASRVTPEYPFWHLGSERRLWEVHGITDVPTATDRTAAAGLTRQAAVLLRDHTVRTKVISLLMDRYLSSDVDLAALRRRVARIGARSRARDVLRPLVGIEIRTVTGIPNMILAMDEDTVTVRTGVSPAGQPVGINEVQRGLDRLAEQGTVRANVAELGHRSAFVAAVLATLPTARVSLNPATITLDEVGAEAVGDDPDFGATDSVAQVKVRREQARLRKLLSGGRTVAPCALCGHDYPVDFLVAAHVKRRAVCTEDERKDLHNVAMLACTFGCDTLYETGWITVDSTGHIRAAAIDGLPEAFRSRITELAGRVCLTHHANSEPYFAWHRTTIFRGTDRHRW